MEQFQNLIEKQQIHTVGTASKSNRNMVETHITHMAAHFPGLIRTLQLKNGDAKLVLRVQSGTPSEMTRSPIMVYCLIYCNLILDIKLLLMAILPVQRFQCLDNSLWKDIVIIMFEVKSSVYSCVAC